MRGQGNNSILRELEEQQGNIAVARNAGAEAASGDIIIFLDADTTISRQFVDEMKKYFQDPNVVGVGGLMPNRTNALAEIVFYFFNFLIMISFF